MIQMGDGIAVERCLQNLNNVTIGTEGKLQLGFSKQAFLADVTNPYILPDKTASFKDFTGSKNNRCDQDAETEKKRASLINTINLNSVNMGRSCPVHFQTSRSTESQP